MSSKTSPRLSSLIDELKAAARENGTGVWADVARRLEGPRRTHAEVNLGRIERYAREDETVVVPGKVLGSGALRKGVTVAAVDFSKTAEAKIRQANGEPIRLEQAIERDRDGRNVRVLR